MNVPRSMLVVIHLIPSESVHIGIASWGYSSQNLEPARVTCQQVQPLLLSRNPESSVPTIVACEPKRDRAAEL